MKKFDNEYFFNLFMQYRDGSEEAYIKIVNIYLIYVEEIIDKYFSDCNVEKEDLMSIGKIFLINALNNYRLDMGMDLKGYIYFYVKTRIERYINLEIKKENISNRKIYEDYVKDINLLSTFDIDNELEDKEILQIIYNLANEFNEKDRKIFYYYYGIGGVKLTQVKLTELLNMSRANLNLRLNLIKIRIIDELVKKGYMIKPEEKNEKLRRFHM